MNGNTTGADGTAPSSRNNPTCQCCHYYRHLDRGNGSCHRYPPVFGGESSPREDRHWRFPTVALHTWCGEFKAIAELP